jgi:hypothetical protein
MSNVWLDVALADYEAHMAYVGQAQVLGRVFAQALTEIKPHRVAVLGAAGGNGFDRLPGSCVSSTIAVDINRDYLRELERRHAAQVPGLEIVCGDLADFSLDFAPVDYIHAALVFEFVDPVRVLGRSANWLTPEGTMGVVLQLPGTANVSRSPYPALDKLGPAMSLMEPEHFRQMADAAGLAEVACKPLALPGGKRFLSARYRLKQGGQKG